jgi:hypothetical protein
MPIQTAADSISNSAGSPYGFKNRIINGAMAIDQRNAGASVTPTSATYTLDRWRAACSQASKYSVQQSSTAPSGFTNSSLITSLSAYTVGASENFRFEQFVEGFNASDLGWGTANAQTVTLSFWVRNSLTGTFGGAFLNSAENRSYPFTYTINSANTFEYKTITVAGDTSGTWLTTNGIGIRVSFSLGAGSTVSGTAGVWSGSFFTSATGATSVVGTSGATFYITGVQLEKGTQATAFDYRPFGTELQLCQRYFCKTFPYATAPAQNSDTPGVISFISQANQLWDAMWRFPVELRTTPVTMTTYSPNAANANWSNNSGTPTASIVHYGSTGMTIRATTPPASGYSFTIHASATAEL